MDFVNKYIEKIKRDIEIKYNLVKNIEDGNIETLLDIRMLLVSEYYSNKKSRMGRLTDHEKEFNERLKNECNDRLIEFDIIYGINSAHFPSDQNGYLGYKYIHRII